MTGRVYKIGGKCIEILSAFDEIHSLCKDYLTEASADFTVKTEVSDIAFERKKSADDDRKEGRKVREFSDSYLETLAVYRKIADRLAESDTILFHGSCIAVDGYGYLFTAKSGTGKSTHTRLWREMLGERAVMVNDDKPLIRISESVAEVFGTPWDGKHRLSTNISVPLKGICILERSAENSIVRISKQEAFPMLLQQTHRIQSADGMMKIMALLDRLGRVVPLYRLKCNMELKAAEMAFSEMKGNKNET